MADATRQLGPAIRALLAAAGEDADADLLARFVSARDEPAFVELMRRHGPMVLGVSRRVTRDAHAAEDVFQATFLLLARKAHAIRRAGALGAWLHQTAFRLALRSRKARGEVRAARPRASNDPSPLDTLTAREMLAILDEELARLPDEYRAAVVACCLEGLSQEEAARRLGWTAGSVKGHLERGRARLRLRLERRGLTLPSVLAAPLLDAGSCGGLMQATRAVVFEGKATASVLALIEGGAAAMSLAKLNVVAAIVVLCGALGLAAVLPGERQPEKAPPAPPPAKVDPLPAGARLRLGAMERRAIGMKLAVTADGKSILGVGHGAAAITEWDYATGKLRGRRPIPTPSRSSTAMSPDGRWMVTESATREGMELNVWDVAAMKVVKKRVFDGGLAGPGPTVFSADGLRLAVVVQDADGRRVFAWDWQRDEAALVGTAPGKHWCNHAELSADGKQVLVILDRIYCWDIAGKKLLWKIDGEGIERTLILPQGKVLSTESRLGKVVERDLLTGAITATLPLPPVKGDLPYLAATPDGRKLIASTSQSVDIWDLQTGKLLHQLPARWPAVQATPDGKAVLTNKGALQRWDLATGKPAYPDDSRKGHLGEVTALAFAADGHRLASTATDGSVGVWDADAGMLLHLWPSHVGRKHHPGNSQWRDEEAFDVTPDGRRLAFAELSDQFSVRNLATGTERRFYPVEEGRNASQDQVRSLRLAPDGRTMTGFLGRLSFRNVEAGPQYRLMRWDVATGTPTTVCPVDKLTAATSAIDPDGRRFVHAGQVHDAATGKSVCTLEGYDAKTCADAVFSPDGLLVAGGPSWRDGAHRDPRNTPAVQVWETTTGKRVARLAGLWFVGEKAFHPSGQYLAFNQKRALQAWNLRTEQRVKNWEMPEEAKGDDSTYRLSRFAFSPDGKTLATGHPDGTILLWDVTLPRDAVEAMRPGELDTLWATLAGNDARKAYLACCRLADLPGAIPYLQRHLEPARAADATVTRPLIADLDGDTQAKRDEATRRLRELGHRAEPALRAALKASESAEQKRRLNQLLAALETPGVPGGEQLRDLRAVQVLGWIGTPEARKLLHALAEGNPSDPITRQATAYLSRRR